MLQDFLAANRQALIDRCQSVATDGSQPVTVEDSSHGIPVFLDQLIGTLTTEEASDPFLTEPRANGLPARSASQVGETAALHGRELLERGFTLDRVISNYGNFCQAVMNLAYETGAPIEVHEFRTFNRSVDVAIAAVVTEFAHRQSVLANKDGHQAVDPRLVPLAHELLGHLDTATLAMRPRGATWEFPAPPARCSNGASSPCASSSTVRWRRSETRAAAVKRESRPSLFRFVPHSGPPYIPGEGFKLR